jgi:hypothetical protein
MLSIMREQMGRSRDVPASMRHLRHARVWVYIATPVQSVLPSVSCHDDTHAETSGTVCLTGEPAVTFAPSIAINVRMARAGRQQRHTIDLTEDAPAQRFTLTPGAAADGGADVLDLTQDDDADLTAGPGAAAAAPAKPAAKPRRKRSAAAAGCQAAGPGAAQANASAEPAAGESSQRAQHTVRQCLIICQTVCRVWP